MKQSRLMSLVESFANIAIGYLIQCAAFAFFLPFFGFRPSFSDTMLFGAIMTVVSVIRSYALRRAFEALHIRRPLSPFMQAVIAERFRQAEVEGWDARHDDGHSAGTIAQAGAAYLFGPGDRPLIDYSDADELTVTVNGRLLWPWAVEYWKPKDDVRRNFVRGCALGIAAGERLDRLGHRRPA